MTKPRFSVGDKVVIHGLVVRPHLNGHVATVTQADNCWGRFENAIYFTKGWWYWVTPAPDAENLALAEQNLRPFDPPSTWDHEDSVWQPEALKETEEAV